jgi:hypothetical protein
MESVSYGSRRLTRQRIRIVLGLFSGSLLALVIVLGLLNKLIDGYFRDALNGLLILSILVSYLVLFISSHCLITSLTKFFSYVWFLS